MDVVLQSMLRNNLTGMEDFFDEIVQEMQARGPFKSFDDANARLSSSCIRALRAISSRDVRAARRAVPKEKRVMQTYDDCALIAAHITGLLPRRMPAALEERLVLLLRVAMPVYRHLSDKRANFWGGYPYFIISNLLLLGYDEFLDQFQLPSLGADRESTRNKMFEALGWEFVPVNEPPPSIQYIEAPNEDNDTKAEIQALLLQ